MAIRILVEPSLSQKDLARTSKELHDSLQAASQRTGKQISDNLTAAYERAQVKATDAAGRTAVAERALTEVRGKALQTAKDVQAAEEKLAHLRQTEGDASAAVRDVERELIGLRQQHEQVLTRLTRATESHARAARAEGAAVSALRAAFRDAKNDIEPATRAMGSFEQATQSASKAMSSFAEMATPAAYSVLGAGIVDLASVAASAAQSLWLLPAAATAAGVGIGTLVIGMHGFGQAMKDIGDPKKFAEDISHLSPAAQEAALSIQALMPEIHGLMESTQERLFAGVGPEITELAHTYLPALQTSLNSVAGSFSHTFAAVEKQLMSPGTEHAIQATLENVSASFQSLAPTVASLAKAFADISQVGSGFLPGLAKGAADAAKNFADFIEKAKESGDLKKWLGEGLDTLKGLVHLVGTVGKAFMSMAPFAERVLPEIDRMFQGIGKILPGVAHSAEILTNGLSHVVDWLTRSKWEVDLLVGAVDTLATIWFGTKLIQAASNAGKAIGAAADFAKTKLFGTGAAAETVAGQMTTAGSEGAAAEGRVATAAGEVSAALEGTGTAANAAAGEVEAAAAREVEALDSVAAAAEAAAGAEGAAAGAGAGAAAGGLGALGGFSMFPLAMFGSTPDQKSLDDLFGPDKAKQINDAIARGDYQTATDLYEGKDVPSSSSGDGSWFGGSGYFGDPRNLPDFGGGHPNTRLIDPANLPQVTPFSGSPGGYDGSDNVPGGAPTGGGSAPKGDKRDPLYTKPADDSWVQGFTQAQGSNKSDPVMSSLWAQMVLAAPDDPAKAARIGKQIAGLQKANAAMAQIGKVGGSTSSGSGASGFAAGGANVYNPLSDAASGGFTLPNIARMLTTFLAEEAFGNPLGKLESGQVSPYAWWYKGQDGNSFKDAGQKAANSLTGSGGVRGETASNPVYVLDVSGGMGGGGGWPGGKGKGGKGFSSDKDLLSQVPKGQYVWGAADLSKGLADCSGAVEGLVNILDTGTSGTSHDMSTRNEAQWLGAHGFRPTQVPMPGTFQVGWNNVHTQATLPGGTNFNWGSPGAAASGGLAPNLGAWDPSFTNHWYRPVGPAQHGGLNGAPPGPVGGAPLPGALSPAKTGGSGGAPAGGGSKQMGGDNKSGGFGISGGIIGAAQTALAEGAAGAANAFAPGSGGAASAAVDLATQEANRAAGYVGQLAGIGAEGLLETFSLNDSALSDPSKSLPGKVIFGIAGAHPNLPNSAGQSQPPLQKDDQQNGGQKQGDNQFPGITINGGQNFYGQQDSGQVNREMNRNVMQYGAQTTR